MRVLLFVQTGDGRPKCKVRFDADNFIGGRDSMPAWAADRCDYFKADRWWLVECENAAMGRQFIEYETGAGNLLFKSNRSRILAQGGRS